MNNTKDIKMEVMEVHTLFWESYARRDIELRFSLCSEDVTFIGSGLHERALNKTEYKNINKEGVKQFPDPFQIEFLWTNLSMLNEVVACVESEVVWSQLINNEMSKELLRNTTLLKYDNNKWLVTHVHGSVPDYRLKDGDYMTNEQTIIRNRELERQVFERTQDLNKTLEELEQKNRELEIETALEKVRSSALAMKEPTDMLDVCRIISDQLQSLGVNEIRNVQTAIFYETKKTYINFEYYAKHNKSLITEVDYRTHELQELFAGKMIKGVEELFSETLKSKEVKDWYAYQKTTNQFADSFLETAESLSYYWYSLGPVALGMSTYVPLNKQEINLFKRFRNVFELAYRRFLDIQQAEAQAKEAKIEASLEKVRAVALSLKKSDEMLDIAQTLYEQLLELGFTNIRNTIIDIHNDANETFLDYDYSHDMGKTVTLMSYHDDPIIEKQVRQIESSSDAFFEIILEGQDLQDLIDMRLKNGEKEDPRLRQIEQLTYNLYSFGNGAIGISNFGLLSDKQKIALKRFRNVFAFAYKRYNDLVLAEAQAREAQIEAALERVRARTMAMQRSEELSETAAVLFNEIKKNTEDELIQLTIGIYNEAAGLMEMRVTSWAGGGVQENRAFNLSIEEPTVLKPAFTAWKQKKKSIVIDLSGEQLEGWLKYRNANTGVTVHSADTKGRRVITVAFFSKGHISLSSPLPISAETIQLLERFATVFDGTYTRFLDLQNAEAQAREARIESALEKIRSRALAMRNSSEVGNVSTLLFLELEKMDINPSGFSIMIFDEEQDKYELWRAKEVANQGAYETFSIKGMFDKFDQYVPGFSEELKSAWTKGNPFFVGEFRGEKRVSFLQANREMANYSDEAFEKMQKGWPDPTFWHLVFFKYGWFGVLQNKQLIKEELLLIHRFAEVFDFAYTRFLDLRKAEAQAREAKIEASLERVRSKTMGMQKSEELKDVIQVVYEQFVHLKINVDHAGFVVDYTPKGDWHFWIADEQDIPSKITHPYFESVWANQFNEAKEKGADFFATNLNFEEKNKFYNELLSYIPGLPEASKDFYLSCPGLAGSTVLLDNVGLYFENFSGIPYSDEDNATLMRFGKVFQQTYTRFLDLQRAEEQNRIIQAENDRKTKELEDARQLQLSMLPKELPQLTHLDIAVYMKTATEVGGDYYDFNVDSDGTLTILVGDATGHGMMSGMMVSIMKAFFISNRKNIELKQFFENSNNSIKDMQLGRLMMGLIGIQITSEKIIATNAGMPSLIYFRNKSQKAGEFVSNNLPLGAMKGTKYLLKEINYEPGDALLLMSDGFGELKNKNNEQYSYPRIIEEFRSVAHKNSDAIVEHLKDSATEWIMGIEPDDDVTIVLIKIR